MPHAATQLRPIGYAWLAQHFKVIEETIEKELPAELRYLQHYDAARAAMRDVVDMPEPAANLFLRLCLQNDGRLSKAKRNLPAFDKLTPREISALEYAIARAYAAGGARNED